MIQGQDKRGNAAVIRCKVPLAEMFGYTTDLRSNTQGRAQSSMSFSSYEKVNDNIAQKIIAERSGQMKAMDAE
jgi:elongation factor G